MLDAAFDEALLTAAFALAARDGWHSVSVAAAAALADLPLDRARARFAGRDAILLRFGRLADTAACDAAGADGTPRDRLFDALMRRFDVLQVHREGVRALLAALPTNPALALLLATTTRHSMGDILEAAGLGSTGLRGLLRTKGLMAVWLYATRTWEADASPDLSATMAALDRALTQAERFGQWLDQGPRQEDGPKPFPEDPASPPAMDPVAA
jgi:hypothetical protein